MALHEEFGDDLWTLGSQPPLLLTLHKRVEWLDEAWNFRAASLDSPERLRKIKVLHFNGHFKPWFPLVSHGETADDDRSWKRLAADRWLFYNKRMWDADCQPMGVVLPLSLWDDAFDKNEAVVEEKKIMVEASQHSALSMIVAVLFGIALGVCLPKRKPKRTNDFDHET